jgi:electron transfer flavoprotein beta subunit
VLFRSTMLNMPTVNAVSKITPSEDELIVERTLENEIEVLAIPLPAVISVTTDINLPRIPSMKNILAAGKKPVTVWDLEAVGLQGAVKKTEVISTLAPEQVDRKKMIWEGDSAEVIRRLFESIRQELL